MSFALSKAVDPLKVFLTNSSNLEARWDPNYYRCMGKFWNRMSECPYPIEQLKKSLALVQYGISERAIEDAVGIPMLRMNNLQDDTWDISSLKYIEMKEEEKERFLLHQGDILFNRTNSKELVGKCCVFNLPGDYVFASYLIRVRVRAGTLREDYVTAFLSSELGRIQIDAVSRQIAGMTNINAEEIKDLLIPRLDDGTQSLVVDIWKAAIRRRDETIETAKGILAGIDDILLDELGIPRKPAPPNTLESRIFQSSSTDFTGRRWDPLFHQADVFAFVRDANSKLIKLGHLVNYFNTGFPAGRGDQADKDDGGVIHIRPTNMSSDRELIFNRNVYIDPVELKARKADVLKRREVLFNNTNSQEQVGKTVWFDLEGDYFSSNHITRIGTKSAELDPQYLAYILNLYQRKKAFFKLCTNWNNQSGVGSDILQHIPIPVPNPARQAEIVNRLEVEREKAQSLREQAIADLEKAKRDIEALILGKEAAQ
jgi:restriction endonuclease S subunit